MSNQSTPDFIKRITNNHDELSDPFGKKEYRDELLYELANNAFANPYTGTEQYGVICMLNFSDPQQNATPQTAIKSGVKALIRPIGDQAQDQFFDEICKHKNDRKKLVQVLRSGGARVMISDKILGDTNGYVPSVGDKVPIRYVDEGPAAQGKQRNMRWELKRAGRAPGGFTAACIEALGGNMDASLFANGNAGGTIGGEYAGPGGTASGNGIGAKPGTISEDSMKHWPSGIIGMEKGEKSQTCDPAIFNKAIKRIDWWMNVKNNPLWANKRVPHGKKYAESVRVRKPNILTIVDATPSKKVKDRNVWTFDLTTGRTVKTAGLLVWTWGGIGNGSFHPNSQYPPKSSSAQKRGAPVDFNNGENSTSPGMKILGSKRSFKKGSAPPKGSRARRALEIHGMEPWNTREACRGAIAHETDPSRRRATSFGCLASHGEIWEQPGIVPASERQYLKKQTASKSVHFHAWEVWTGGSWLFVYTGDDFGPSKTGKDTDPAKVPGNVYWKPPDEAKSDRCGDDKRDTWNWSLPYGGHTASSSGKKKKSKKKKKK